MRGWGDIGQRRTPSGQQRIGPAPDEVAAPPANLVQAGWGADAGTAGRFVVEADGLVVSAILRLSGTRIVVDALLIRDEDGSQDGVTGQQLRGLPLGTWVEDARRQIATMDPDFARGQMPDGSPDPRLTSSEQQEAMAAAAPAWMAAERPVRGRKSLGDDWYRRVAHEYLWLRAQGYGRGIHVELARVLGEPGKAPPPVDTVRSWVTTAVRLGFLLPAGKPGAVGRGPGPRLLCHDGGGG